jgi:hypothetical protein
VLEHEGRVVQRHASPYGRHVGHVAGPQSGSVDHGVALQRLAFLDPHNETTPHARVNARHMLIDQDFGAVAACLFGHGVGEQGWVHVTIVRRPDAALYHAWIQQRVQLGHPIGADHLGGVLFVVEEIGHGDVLVRLAQAIRVALLDDPDGASQVQVDTVLIMNFVQELH